MSLKIIYVCDRCGFSSSHYEKVSKYIFGRKINAQEIFLCKKCIKYVDKQMFNAIKSIQKEHILNDPWDGIGL